MFHLMGTVYIKENTFWSFTDTKPMQEIISTFDGSRQSYTTNVPTVLSQKDVLLKDLSCLYLLNFLTNVRSTHLKNDFCQYIASHAF